MPIVNSVAKLTEEVTEWRRYLHSTPELLYEETETADFVAQKLGDFGLDVYRGLAKTGVVGVLKGTKGNSSRWIGLRADMDALPIEEAQNHFYRSKNEGTMHACGHDGHMAMLLGAAKHLSENNNFDGTVAFIFQPAEEGGAGAQRMIEDGLFDKFPCEEVYGMHNMPGMPLGSFGTREGAIMAAVDEFDISIEGLGAHAAMPHNGIDPIMVATQVYNGVQSLVSRQLDPLDPLVISITKVSAGDAYNVIPQSATLNGTVRSQSEDVRTWAEEQIQHLVAQICKSYGAEAKIHYHRTYPATINTTDQTDFAVSVAKEIAGPQNVNGNLRPSMGGEDFSFMLQKKPGCFIYVGNGSSKPLHHPAYDFNDDVIPYGVSYWVGIVKRAFA